MGRSGTGRAQRRLREAELGQRCGTGEPNGDGVIVAPEQLARLQALRREQRRVERQLRDAELCLLVART